MRLATFNTELFRKGPGLLLRDIQRGTDPQVIAVLGKLKEANADVIALQGFDYDFDLLALAAFEDALRRSGGPDYPFRFAAPPNAGRMTDVDLDGDGRTGRARDAQGYGRFYGQGSMALLSRFPINKDTVQDYSEFLWRDLPDALLSATDTGQRPDAAVLAVQRLHAHGAWVVPIEHPILGQVHVMTFHAAPPVFDGPEDRNGRRNHDEVRFWSLYLDGVFGPPPTGCFAIVGDANADRFRGEGRADALTTLLTDRRLQDPLPRSLTVNWEQTGPMRVDYILPSRDWRVSDAGVLPPDPKASRHRLVWVDLKR